MPRRTRGRPPAQAGGDGKCHRKLNRRPSRDPGRSVRVKRRGKSPPPGAQAPGHEKPHAVQDITGGRAACPVPQTAGQPPGISRIRRLYGAGIRSSGRVREMIVRRDESSGDRIRLIALRKRRRFRETGSAFPFCGNRKRKVYFVERSGSSRSTNTSRNRNSRGRFIESILDTRREAPRVVGFLS